jgi:2-keto-3-deoxy-L-rhamnonate aldolase RhmA
MSTVPNHALRQLRAGRLAIGLGLRQARTVDIAQIAKTAGFDWLFIDCEHNSMDGDTAAQIAAASLAVGITPVVRVAGLEHWLASRMLDNGAQGIVFPHIDTAEEARRAANACRFPPVGKRSMGGGLQQLGFATMPVGEAARIVNEETLVVAMIESPRGVTNCEEIAAVPGIDALLIGTNDLCFEIGIPASSTTRASPTPTARSLPPAAGTASSPAWAASTPRSSSSAISAWACSSSSPARTSRSSCRPARHALRWCAASKAAALKTR